MTKRICFGDWLKVIGTRAGKRHVIRRGRGRNSFYLPWEFGLKVCSGEHFEVLALAHSEKSLEGFELMVIRGNSPGAKSFKKWLKRSLYKQPLHGGAGFLRKSVCVSIGLCLSRAS